MRRVKRFCFAARDARHPMFPADVSLFSSPPSEGDIIFYDKKVSGTCRQMGAVRCPAVTADWSPDGRYLLTATVAPRMRVDNTFKLFTYYGKQASILVC